MKPTIRIGLIGDYSPEITAHVAIPRALALAEVIWSPVAGRNFDSFAWRLNAQYPLLDRLKVNYRKPDAETTRREPEKK